MGEDTISIVTILGPTASGKTDLAMGLAERFDGEIVNADSMQVYRGMDIGTAKPSLEMRRRVPHHLIDIVDPDVNFTASDFRREAMRVIGEIHRRGKRVFVVGGTGLYIRALLEGLVDSPGGDEALRMELKEVARKEGNDVLWTRLAEVDPVTAARLYPNDQVRIIRALEVYLQSGLPISRYRSEHGFAGSYFRSLKIGIAVEREELYRRIDLRVDKMIERGFVAEVDELLRRGFAPGLKSMRSIGYRQLSGYLLGEMPFEEAVRILKRDTRHYAKRQLTWFRRDPEIKWVEYPESSVTIYNNVIEFFD